MAKVRTTPVSADREFDLTRGNCLDSGQGEWLADGAMASILKLQKLILIFLLGPLFCVPVQAVCLRPQGVALTKNSQELAAVYVLSRVWQTLFLRDFSGGSSREPLIPRLPGLIEFERLDLLQGIDWIWLQARRSPQLLQFRSGKDPIFVLNPSEAPRLAVTGDGVNDPIYFNLDLLKIETLSYGDLVQLMIHELGHKWMASQGIPKTKRAPWQAKVDTAAAVYARLYSAREWNVSFGPMNRLFFANPLPMGSEGKLGAKQSRVLPIFLYQGGQGWLDLMPLIENKLREFEKKSKYFRDTLIVSNVDFMHAGLDENDDYLLRLKVWVESSRQEKADPLHFDRPQAEEFTIDIGLPERDHCADIRRLDILTQRPELIADSFEFGFDTQNQIVEIEIEFKDSNRADLRRIDQLLLRFDGKMISVSANDPRLEVEWVGAEELRRAPRLRIKYRYSQQVFAWKKIVLGVVVRAGPAETEFLIPSYSEKP